MNPFTKLFRSDRLAEKLASREHWHTCDAEKALHPVDMQIAEGLGAQGDVSFSAKQAVRKAFRSGAAAGVAGTPWRGTPDVMNKGVLALALHIYKAPETFPTTAHRVGDDLMDMHPSTRKNLQARCREAFEDGCAWALVLATDDVRQARGPLALVEQLKRAAPDYKGSVASLRKDIRYHAAGCMQYLLANAALVKAVRDAVGGT